jgi:hypothetical protein
MSTTINTWVNDKFDNQPNIGDDDYDDSKAMKYLKDHTSKWVQIEVWEFHDGIQVTVTDTPGESKQGPNDKHLLLNRWHMGDLMEVVYKMNSLHTFYFNTRFGSEFKTAYFTHSLPDSVKHVTLLDSKFGTIEFLKGVNVLTLLNHDIDEDIEMSDGQELVKLVNLEKDYNVKIIVEMLRAETEEDFVDNFENATVLELDC